MALTLKSPGVQIIETDISQNVTIPGGTTVFIPGFARQGPTDEVLQITSISEFESVYGTPTSPAERYFYYNSQAVLNSNGNLLTTRLPYGSAGGTGFANSYSALLYPVASGANTFTLSNPTHITLTESQYDALLQNNFTWSSLSSAAVTPSFTGVGGTLNAGLVVINTAQTSVDEANQGYYVALTDNTNWGPTSTFNSVQVLNSLSGNDDFASVANSSLTFSLTSSTAGESSISQVIETIPTWNFGVPYYQDSLVLSLFKIRNSTYQPNLLTFTLTESYIGSLNSQKRGVGNIGGTPNTQFLTDVVNQASNNINVLINPNISHFTNWNSLTGTNPAYTVTNTNKALNTVGVWAPTYNYRASNTIGALDAKVNRALSLINTPEDTVVDVVVDAGLTTIFANTKGANIAYNDGAYGTTDTSTISYWQTMFNIFNTFVQDTRKDCVFIADPLRQIFVNGPDAKTLSVSTNTFTTNIYTPLQSSLNNIDTNYSAIYGNWAKTFDTYTNTFVWVPISGYVAGIYANNDAATQPWIAPAGLNRGIIRNITDIAFNPNQKQRDYLYTIGVNPVCLFSGEGYAVYGQKTLQSKPSAFDRINVRRLFLTLERAVQGAVKYFVFEPNTDFTRTRLVNTIAPVFELAKNTQGLFDYLIVCDERNNTPLVIDNNELVVDIYIKPVRAAEFILVNFIATRTGQNFNELI
jgi:phage tail sheath protein FI